MCGIVGAIAQENALDVITRTLQNLDYRGYDSWGVFCPPDFTHKSLEKVEHLSSSQYKIGIGHTRWATHGDVTCENAHPVFSPANDFCVVHNGIYDYGYEDSRQDTRAFVDQLWTILSNYKVQNSEIYFNTISTLINERGDNAFLIVFKSLPDRIFAFTRGSKELYISDKGVIASSIDSLGVSSSKKCRKLPKNCTIIENNTGFVIDDGEEVVSDYTFLYDGLEEVNAVPKFQPRSESCMLSEIEEQGNLDFFPQKVDKIDFPVFIGCGSSYYAGKFAKVHYRKFGEYAECEYASEFILPNTSTDNTYVLISQSGETQDILNVANKLQNEDTLIFTNNVYSPLYEYANEYINIDCGKEYAVAATKTFFFTCLNLINSLNNDPRYYFDDLEVLANAIKLNMENWKDFIKDRVENQYNFNKALFLGSGYTYPIAQEAALKMKEVCQIPSDAVPSNEIKHGPIALVDENTLCVVLSDEHNDNAREVESRGAQTLFIPSVMGDFQTFPNYLRSLATVIPCQLLAYYQALHLELDPDKPRHLAKTVTV